jgi:hypothetical protein
MLFDGKLDAVDLMAIDYQEEQDRKEKLKIVVQWIKKQNTSSVDISDKCYELGLLPLKTGEFDWILKQIQED